jgi:short-subunit dehydrogenase
MRGRSDAVINDIGKSGRQIHILINSAGVLHQKPHLELTDAEIGD